MTALIDYGTTTVELEVSLAVGDQAGAGVWDASAFGFAVWSNPDTSLGDWLDVTCDVTDLSISAGASQPDGVVTKIDGTTGTLTLHGPQWDPWGGPWPANTLGPAVPARIRWRVAGSSTWQPVYTGLTDGWPYDVATETAAIPLIDATGQLANLTLQPQAAPVGTGDTIAARIGRWLDAANWPASSRDIPAGSDPVRCVNTLLDGAPWDAIVVAADTDLGVVWVNRAGSVAFRPLAQVNQWTPSPTGYTLTDQHTGDPNEICVVNYTRADPEVVRNIVTIANVLPEPGGGTSAVQTARSDASVFRYGPKTYDRQDLISDSDTWAAELAQVVLTGCAYPAPHPQAAELDVRADARCAQLLLGAELTQTIPARLAGTLYPCVIVGYQVDLTRGQLTGELVLEDASRFQAGHWDAGQWDVDNWGV